jgi:Protein of unknown function (DUF3046)
MSSPTSWWPRSSPSSRCAEVRRSEFERAVSDEFGARGPAIVADLVLSELGGRTPVEALDAGLATRDVWLALCEATDVPLSRRHGAGRLEPKRH